MSRKQYHISYSVAHLRDLFWETDQTGENLIRLPGHETMTISEAREKIGGFLVENIKYIQDGECDNFCPQKGCLGHEPDRGPKSVWIGGKFNNIISHDEKGAPATYEEYIRADLVREVIEFCAENTSHMWAASIVGMLFECDFRESERLLKERGFLK